MFNDLLEDRREGETDGVKDHPVLGFPNHPEEARGDGAPQGLHLW